MIFVFFSDYFVDLLNHDTLSRKPLLFRSFTGLELSEFDSICKESRMKYPEYEIKRLSKIRRIEQDQEVQEDLSNIQSETDFSYFLWTKNLRKEFVIGFIPLNDQSNVHRDIRYMEPIVKSCIPLPQKLYNITRRREPQYRRRK